MDMIALNITVDSSQYCGRLRTVKVWLPSYAELVIENLADPSDTYSVMSYKDETYKDVQILLSGSYKIYSKFGPSNNITFTTPVCTGGNLILHILSCDVASFKFAMS